MAKAILSMNFGTLILLSSSMKPSHGLVTI